jgi:hypothetical protein
MTQKTKYTDTPTETLWKIWRDAWNTAEEARKKGQWSKYEKHYWIFSEAKQELRYVRKLY